MMENLSFDVPTLPTGLLDRRQAAGFLTERGYKTAVATLAKLACLGGGPVFRSFGRKPLYSAPELLAWAEARTTGPRRSTSEVA
jgi:hypothetical protein